MPKQFDEALARLKSPQFIKLYELPEETAGGTNWIKFAAIKGISVGGTKGWSWQGRKNEYDLEAPEQKIIPPTLKSTLGETFSWEPLNENPPYPSPKLHIVITIPRSPDYKDGSKESKDNSVRDAVLNSAKMWRGKLKSPFITYPIYFNDQGHKYTIRANSDFTVEFHRKKLFLSRYKNKHPGITESLLASPSWLKRCLGQILLGVKDLHDNRFALNDITPNNILRHWAYHKLEINDFDGLIQLNEKGRAISPILTEIPLPYRAPELYTEQKIEAPSGVKEGLHTPPEIYYQAIPKTDLSEVDFTKVDSFSIGAIMRHHMTECAYWDPELSLREPFLDLQNKLIEKDPAKRLSVAEAMEHPFFGETHELREKFFAEILVPPVDIDGFPISAELRPNDTFLLLPAPIKKVYVELQKFNATLDAKNATVDFFPIRNSIAEALLSACEEINPYKEELAKIKVAVEKEYVRTEEAKISIVSNNGFFSHSTNSNKKPARHQNSKQKTSSSMCSVM